MTLSIQRKYLLIVPLVFIFAVLKESSIMALGNLFFFLILVAAMPFSAESNGKYDKMYYMLPSKISSMVLGRFLYLISMMLIIWIMSGSLIIYLHNTNALGQLETILIYLAGFAAAVICFCQYPLYYKLGMENGNIISMILSIIPAFVIWVLPSILLKKNSFFTPEFLNKILFLTMNNKIILPFLGIVIISIMGISSYLLSCSICERKEI